MKKVNFNKDIVSAVEIDEYYNRTLEAIESYYNPQKNADYNTAFAYLTKEEISQMLLKDKRELSAEAGLMLLAYIESLFRTDFVLRVESNKWRDQLTIFYKHDFRISDPIYKYGTDSIIDAWKQYYPNLT